MKTHDMVDYGKERVSLKIIMNRLGSKDSTKTDLAKIINRTYLFNNQTEARNFIEYIIGLDPIPVKHENGTVFRTDIYN